MIKAIFFDVANTLLHKPSLFEKMGEVFAQRGFSVSPGELAYKHKLVSEIIEFPDRTDEQFYRSFNSHFIYSLGIRPDEALVADLFKNCSYLPWHPFDDTKVLSLIKIPVGIISNWDKKLTERLKQNFTTPFSWILGSEETGLRKPDTRFFAKMVERSHLQPEEIMMVGDSVRLDMAPAAEIGIRPVLVDRIGAYPDSSYEKISTLLALEALIQ